MTKVHICKTTNYPPGRSQVPDHIHCRALQVSNITSGLNGEKLNFVLNTTQSRRNPIEIGYIINVALNAKTKIFAAHFAVSLYVVNITVAAQKIKITSSLSFEPETEVFIQTDQLIIGTELEIGGSFSILWPLPQYCWCEHTQLYVLNYQLRFNNRVLVGQFIRRLRA